MDKKIKTNKNYMRAFMSRAAHKRFKIQCAELDRKMSDNDFRQAMSLVEFFDIISSVDLVDIAFKKIK